MSTDNSSTLAAGGTEFDPELLKAGQTLAGVFTLIHAMPSAMGESPVWMAHDQVAEREVSLHFVPAAVGTDPDLCDLLRAEVRRCRQLIHPNILRVHDLSDEPQWSAVVMDPYEGQSLARLLQENQRGFFEASEVFPWVESVLQTLRDAHGIGLLHRNLNLNDIILGEEGKVTLAKFGMSRVIVDALRRHGAADESQLVYSSPKQLSGELPSVADDIYSFGACLFELLTGRAVFVGRGVEGRVKTERPLGVMECRQQLGRSGDLLYPNWEKVIVQCLSKDPAERPSSVDVLEERLGLRQLRAARATGVAARAASRPAAAKALEAEKAPERDAEKEPLRASAAEDYSDLDADASEKANFGAPRPLFSSPKTEVERSRQNRNALIFWLIAAGGIGAGIWFGSDALLKSFSSKPPVVAPEPEAVVEVDKAKEGKFVPPAAPGTDPELTALRPGLPPRPGEKTAGGAPIEPIPLDPPKSEASKVAGGAPAAKPASVPGSPVAAAPSAAALKGEEKVPREEGSPALQEARVVLEGAQAELENASKKVDRLKAIKNPSSSQRNALASAKKAKLAAEKKVAEAQKLVEELSTAPVKEKEEAKPEDPKEMKEAKPGASAPTVPVSPSPAEAPAPGAPGVKPEAGKAEAAPEKAPEKAGEKPAEKLASKTEKDPEKAPEKRKTLEVGRNSIGMEFVPVGEVMFSVYETRLKDYMTFASETGHARKAWKSPGFEQSLDHPVVRVSWNDANLFCKWLTERERKLGLLEEGEYYRLPTDQEWSLAVGLPTEEGSTPQERDRQYPDQFPWGGQWPPVPGAGNFNGQETGSDIAIKGYSDPFPWTAPVGSGRANAAGVFDLGGNVWEWVMDTYNKDSKTRVLRGGAYDSSLKDALMSSCRLPAQPERERDQWGFRVVRSKDGGKAAPKDP